MARMARKKSDKSQITEAEKVETITAVCADTIYRISRAYDVSVPELKKLNPGITTAFIRKGTQVRIK